MSCQSQVIRSGVRVAGDVADVHARLEYHTASGLPAIEFCGVYVHPVESAALTSPFGDLTRYELTPGYWYFPEDAEARELLTVAGVLS